MIKAGSNRTWMKVTTPSGVAWVRIENDVIVDVIGIRNLRLRADDTLSLWVRGGWVQMEGPFDEPE